MEEQVTPPETGPWAGRYRHWTIAGFLAAAYRLGSARPHPRENNEQIVAAQPYDGTRKPRNGLAASTPHQPPTLVFRPAYPPRPEEGQSAVAAPPFHSFQGNAFPTWMANELSLPLDQHFALYGTRLVWTSVSLPLNPFLHGKGDALAPAHLFPQGNPRVDNSALNP